MENKKVKLVNGENYNLEVIFDKMEDAFSTVMDEFIEQIDDPMMLMMIIMIQARVMTEVFGDRELGVQLDRVRLKRKKEIKMEDRFPDFFEEEENEGGFN